MKEPLLFYNEQISGYKHRLSQIKKRLYVSSMLRLVVFCAAAIGVYLAFGNGRLVACVVVTAIVVFVFLVSRHTDLQYKCDRIKALLQINITETEVLQRKYHHLPDGKEFNRGDHCFCQDIDLFGRGSFYQYANRTALKEGGAYFSSLLLGNDIRDIPTKQEAVDELAKMPKWRQEFSAAASLVKTEVPFDVIIKWLKDCKVFVPRYMSFFPIVFSLISIVLATMYFMDLLSGWGVVFWMVLGLGITGGYLKKINRLSADTSRVQSTFHQYQKLIMQLENTQFTAGLLKERQALVLQGEVRTSKILERFSRILNAFDQRNNMLFGFLGNAFLLWDLWQSFRLEKWIKDYGGNVSAWFDVVVFFDAYNSLGNFAYNHPDYTFPKIINGDIVLKPTKAGHPLLDSNKSVLNDFQIDKEQFFIVTGANMAGKSTFLRTVSFQIVMANVGLPVCASYSEYSPIKLITSMRTSDSLADDESYFFSELKRLKFIVDEIQKDRYFIILDEILKGTNSTDKAIGSRKFVEKLVASESTGIIATHDLSLCKVAEDMSQVHNFYFDADIINNELHFDYTLKKGICKNMNASFLLKKMGIVG
ncbi:MAG: DNA mismatch repair protein MutS [Maribacter sp.]|nr:MAG: DNA mismatch repair protein MutS [Maribacter sp.]